MPKGEHLANADVISKRVEARSKSRLEFQKFFLHVGPNLRVTRDNYNIVLLEKVVTESGKNFVYARGFFDTPAAAGAAAVARGATTADFNEYNRRTAGVIVKWENGKMNIRLPPTFAADPYDIDPDSGGADDD